ncbi:MAG: hypothetical protein ACJ72Z_08030 [Pyrinomonadaceae bacterium]
MFVSSEVPLSANEGQHEDPCSTLIICNNDQRSERPARTFGHDASQHNLLFDQLSRHHISRLLHEEPRLSSATVNGLFRPPNPPFHPPQNS